METQQNREMFEESRAAQSATGPKEKPNVHDKYDVTLMTVKFDASIIEESNPRHQKDSKQFASYAAKLCAIEIFSCVTESHFRS